MRLNNLLLIVTLLFSLFLQILILNLIRDVVNLSCIDIGILNVLFLGLYVINVFLNSIRIGIRLFFKFLFFNF